MINIKSLNVGWESQVDPNSNYAIRDCGVACTLMLKDYMDYRKHNYTVNSLAKLAGMTYDGPGLGVQNIIKLAGLIGMQLNHILGFNDIVKLKNTLDIGLPIIALVRYHKLGTRYDQSLVSGHYIVICGYDDTGFFIRDPYWPSLNHVRNLHITTEVLMEAWKSGPECPDFVNSYQGLVPTKKGV